MPAWTSVSPLKFDFSEQPWILWEKKTSLAGLNARLGNELSVSDEATNNVPVHIQMPETRIKRNQYQSVLNRISTAQRKAGAYYSI